MLGRGGILLCPRGFPAVTVRLKLRDGAAKSPCTCGLVSEIYMDDDGHVYIYFTLEEAVGFEPTDPCGSNDFESFSL